MCRWFSIHMSVDVRGDAGCRLLFLCVSQIIMNERVRSTSFYCKDINLRGNTKITLNTSSMACIIPTCVVYDRKHRWFRKHRRFCPVIVNITQSLVYGQQTMKNSSRRMGLRVWI